MKDTSGHRQEGPRSNDGPGEQMAWSIISTLVAGPIVWGGIGALVDHFAHTTNRVFTALGVVVGFITSVYIVYIRFGRDSRP